MWWEEWYFSFYKVFLTKLILIASAFFFAEVGVCIPKE